MQEAETNFEKRRNLVDRALDFWSKPHFFDNPMLYERLGVRLFRDIFLTRQRATNWKILDLFSNPHHISKLSPESLASSLAWTRKDETIHLFGFIGTLGLSALGVLYGNTPLAIVVSGANLPVNVYPIMVQRYNRARLNKIKLKLDARDQRDDSKLPDFVA